MCPESRVDRTLRARDFPEDMIRLQSCKGKFVTQDHLMFTVGHVQCSVVQCSEAVES